MKEAARFSVFEWPRGDPTKWRILADHRSGLPSLVVYEEGWPHPWDNPCRPLEDAPRLYEELAALGADAESRGQQLSKEAPPVFTEHVSGRREPLERPDSWVAFAAEDRAIHRRVLRFIRAYGPLHLGMDSWAAGSVGVVRGRDVVAPVGARLADFLREAYELTRGIRLAKEVRAAEGDALSDADRRTDARLSKLQTNLQMAFSAYLPGVSLALPRDETSGRLFAAYSCLDLLSACWLQLYEAFTGARTWRTCKGCGRLFAMADPRQEYHDTACRNRSNARRSRRKARQKGGQ